MLYLGDKVVIKVIIVIEDIFVTEEVINENVKVFIVIVDFISDSFKIVYLADIYMTLISYENLEVGRLILKSI